MTVARGSRSESGVTLVELLIVLVLFSVIGGITVAGIVSAFGSSIETQTRIEARQELELAAQQITRFLRGADGGSASGLIIRDDSDREVGSQFFRGGSPEITFFGLEGSAPDRRLVQCFGAGCLDDPDESSRQLVTNVDNDDANLVFTYLDRSGDEVPDPRTAAMIKVRLIRGLDDRNPVIVETRVAVRSVRYDGS